jgi:hypothetical protein
VLFVAVSLIALGIASKDLLVEVSTNSTADEVIKSTPPTIGSKIGHLVKSLQNFWLRVPDELEMFHRLVKRP